MCMNRHILISVCDERRLGFTPSSDCPAGARRFARLRQVQTEPPLCRTQPFVPSLFSALITTTQEQDPVLSLKLVINVKRESFRQDTVSFFSSSLE